MMIKGSLLLSAPIVKHFRRKKVQCVLGQNLTVLGDKWGFNIKFKFHNPQSLRDFTSNELSRVKIHQGSESDLYASLRKKGINK